MTRDRTAAPALTDAEVAEFKQQGILVLRGVLDEDEVARLVGECDRLIADPATPSRQQQADGTWDSIRNTIAGSHEARRLIAHPNVLPAIVRLMGTNLRIITSHLIYRNADEAPAPGQERIPSWHRDIAHVSTDLGFAHTPMLQIKAAFCLADLAGKDSGGTVFLPGSNLFTMRPSIAPGEDPQGAVEPELRAGDCLLFENRTMHAGGWNLSGRVRKSLMIAYGYRWLAPADYRRQSEEARAQMSEVERFLVGESRAPSEEFILGGSGSPLDAYLS
ncbi:phytanoyl-CoA dioxygenase family protein [Pseudarthrobacter sp. RMG13]|uniref:Phytanoyl-CoA dioxygenase family protein n=1 Tax=Pseudarthrobacter humi TaxID=2952523 RepID=A0ABT1LR03_9MICC|nr:phytanoyl-CoA dioxygenase family protein [Pseudarthrobacter humi]MCP9000314.1 phytanoyl-CoA dioxygenase family protein [Pseudarthrobacter humi]